MDGSRYSEDDLLPAIDAGAEDVALDGDVWEVVTGPIDLAAWSRHRWLTGRWRQSLVNNLELGVTVRGYEEKRGNGTPYLHARPFARTGLSGPE